MVILLDRLRFTVCTVLCLFEIEAFQLVTMLASLRQICCVQAIVPSLTLSRLACFWSEFVL